MNGGVNEPLAVRLARSYSVMNVQFIITGGVGTRLWVSEAARCAQRGISEVTAGDCNDTSSCQHGMTGDCLHEDNWGTLMFPLLESKRASALSARAPQYRCDPTLYHPDMTIGGIDDEPIYEPRRQGRLYRGTSEPTKEPKKYRPILSHQILLRIAQVFDIYERAETDQVEIYGAASSRSQKCLLWNRCLVDLIPSTHSSIKPQEISGKSHMPWMSLKLQVIKPAACLCLLMSFSNLSRASSSCQGLVRFCTPSIDYSALSIYLSNSPRPG
ncbi:unnamed protein product [Penicillium nalgiovense]|nr:unnamed protein product [Penicillium nalgiovense]CAG8139258.1 unnamed protein product [Penicillium nalgiovense]